MACGSTKLNRLMALAQCRHGWMVGWKVMMALLAASSSTCWSTTFAATDVDADAATAAASLQLLLPNKICKSLMLLKIIGHRPNAYVVDLNLSKQMTYKQTFSH